MSARCPIVNDSSALAVYLCLACLGSGVSSDDAVER